MEEPTAPRAQVSRIPTISAAATNVVGGLGSGPEEVLASERAWSVRRVVISNVCLIRVEKDEMTLWYNDRRDGGNR